jgi:tRNA (cmo5U34)-methyltransferase
MKSLFTLLSMLFQENVIPGSMQRKPEESLVMDAQDQVEAWHRQGADDGPIIPIYHLHSQLCSRLAKPGSTVVDLGCGSGQFSAYLARRRPDLHIIGIDLSAPMVAVGNDALKQSGLDDRVELLQGDMTHFSAQLPDEVGLISCLFALHHLPSLEEVRQCFADIRSVSEKAGCNVALFDLVRPRHESTTTNYPKALTPDAPEAFRLDSVNSLVAAYSHEELKGVVDLVLGQLPIHSTQSRFLRLYQAFWLEQEGYSGHSLAHSLYADGELPSALRKQVRALKAILPGLPLHDR